MDFHKYISFPASMKYQTTSRNGMDRCLSLLLPHNPRYRCDCPVRYLSSFCTHPNPIEFRPSTSSHFHCQVRKPNPVFFLFVGRQKFRFYEIIFFTRFNLYQTGMPFFAFLLRVFPSFRRRKQFITRLPVANPPLLTS